MNAPRNSYPVCIIHAYRVFPVSAPMKDANAHLLRCGNVKCPECRTPNAKFSKCKTANRCIRFSSDTYTHAHTIYATIFTLTCKCGCIHIYIPVFWFLEAGKSLKAIRVFKYAHIRRGSPRRLISGAPLLLRI